MLQIKHTPLEACKITDHDLLITTLPLSHTNCSSRTQDQPISQENKSGNIPTGLLAVERVGHPKEKNEQGTPPETKNEKFDESNTYRWI
jgi:hypothetical protein